MELLGDNLESYLFSKNGSLPISFVVNVAIQMLTIIQQIHSRYLLHRDIKPRNIVLPYTQQIVDEHYTINDMSKVYLIDFGLSKLYVTSNLTSFSLLPGHIPFSDHNIHSNITGTSRFASISVLTGYGKLFNLLTFTHSFFYLLLLFTLLFIEFTIRTFTSR